MPAIDIWSGRNRLFAFASYCPEMATETDRYVVLDALRGLSAMAVVLFHCGTHLDNPAIMGHGALAVDVFFVMSGFVMERAYGAKLRSGWSLRAFAAARLRRLYPLYAFGILLGVLCVALRLGPHADLSASLAVLGLVACAALFIPIPRDGSKPVFPLNGPSWSLMAEIVVNALYASVLRRLSHCRLLAVALTAALGLGGAWKADLPLLQGGQTATLWLDLTRAAFGFSAGLLLAAYQDQIRATPLGSIRLPVLLAFAVGIYGIPTDALPLWSDLAAILVVSPTIVAAAILIRPAPAMARWCRALGRLSYPLYIVHMPIIYIASTYASMDGELFPARTAMILGSSVVSFSIAWCLSRWIDLPRRAGLAR